jgi:hypothetical protein
MLAVGFFLVAMLCKITMCAFPVIILLYAWWKRGRIGWKDLIVSSPFFVISFALGLATLLIGYAYAPGHILKVDVPLNGFFSRMACMGLTAAFYFVKVILPVNPLPMYPPWNVDPPSLPQFLPWLIMAWLVYFLWEKRNSWGKHVLLALAFFFINLVPFLGVISVTYMRYTWVMDHFLYIPMISLIALMVAGLGDMLDRLTTTTRPYVLGVVVIVMGMLAIESHLYSAKFTSLETLLTYTVRHYPEAWPAHNNLGYTLAKQNRLQEAEVQLKEAIRLNYNYSEAHCNLGVVYARSGRFTEAKYEYQEALKISPDLNTAQINLDAVERIEAKNAAAAAVKKQEPAK